MIVVEIKLVSAISPTRNRLLGRAIIVNDGDGTPQRANYSATFSKWAPKDKETWRRAKLKRFDRVNRGAWDLLFLLLRKAVGERNLYREPE